MRMESIRGVGSPRKDAAPALAWRCGHGDVPIPEHHGVTEALSARFMEPLPAAVALQHLQVPPGEGEETVLGRAV